MRMSENDEKREGDFGDFMESFGGAGVSLLDDYEMKVTPNASECSTEVDQCDLIPLDSFFLLDSDFVYFGLISPMALDLICLEAPKFEDAGPRSHCCVVGVSCN